MKLRVGGEGRERERGSEKMAKLDKQLSKVHPNLRQCMTVFDQLDEASISGLGVDLLPDVSTRDAFGDVHIK